MNNDSLLTLRRDYGDCSLDEHTMPVEPMLQFHRWFDEACSQEQEDPSAMILSTVDALGRPDARVVLLKGIEDEQFVFYTNYESTKAHEMAENTHVALTFYWSTQVRQVRIRGTVSRVDAGLSDAYFASRPYESQLAAVISSQSRIISERSVIEIAYDDAKRCHTPDAVVARPKNWGGYQVLPTEFEFWQGRNNRLHDRIRYTFIEAKWVRVRLAP